MADQRVENSLHERAVRATTARQVTLTRDVEPDFRRAKCRGDVIERVIHRLRRPTFGKLSRPLMVSKAGRTEAEEDATRPAGTHLCRTSWPSTGIKVLRLHNGSTATAPRAFGPAKYIRCEPTTLTCVVRAGAAISPPTWTGKGGQLRISGYYERHWFVPVRAAVSGAERSDCR